MVSLGVSCVLTLPMAIGNTLISSTIIAAVALAGARLAQRWKSGGVRYISYLMQLYASGALILALRAMEISKPSIIGASASGLLACIGLFHYYWCRKNPPLKEMQILKKYDARDRGATLILFAVLLSGFFTLRVGLFQVLNLLGLASPAAFDSGQSTLINISAAVLMLLSYRLADRELRTVAILLTLVGACKVFLIDLMNIKGLPLLISMFSFAIVAAVETYIMRLWNKRKSSVEDKKQANNTVMNS